MIALCINAHWVGKNVTVFDSDIVLLIVVAGEAE